jgi:5,5'-dehydrodivanillate O-demethylase
MAARHARITKSTDAVAEDVLAGRMSPGELDPERYPDLVNIQDYIAQVGIGDIAADPRVEALGRTDIGVLTVRRLWMRELRALANGQPLTRWTRPDRLWSHLTATGEPAPPAAMA